MESSNVGKKLSEDVMIRYICVSAFMYAIKTSYITLLGRKGIRVLPFF